MEKNNNAKKNINVRLSMQQLDFLSVIAIDYNCEPDKIQDVIRALIIEKMKEKGFYKKIYNNEE